MGEHNHNTADYWRERYELAQAELAELRKDKARWQEVAKQLESALLRTPYDDCGELDHSGGHYHSGTETCPVVAKCIAALNAAAAMESEVRNG